MIQKSTINVTTSDRILLKANSRGVPLTRLISALIRAYVENPSIVERHLNAISTDSAIESHPPVATIHKRVA